MLNQMAMPNERIESKIFFIRGKKVIMDEDLRSQFVISKSGGRRYRPYAFTEQGIAMLSIIGRRSEAKEKNWIPYHPLKKITNSYSITITISIRKAYDIGNSLPKVSGSYP